MAEVEEEGGAKGRGGRYGRDGITGCVPGVLGEVGDSVGEVVTVGEGEGEGLECVSLPVATVSLTTCVPFSSGFGALSFASATCPDRASSFLPSTPGSGVTTAAV